MKDVLISIDELKKRYECGVWQVDRWQKDLRLGFPQPIILRRRRYFKLREIQAFEARFTNRFGARLEAA